MPARTVTFSDAFVGHLITVYGNVVGDLPFTDAHAVAVRLSSVGGSPRFAQIRAYRFGTGRCTILPSPTLLVVFGDGQELTDTECGFSPGDVKKWTLPVGTRVVALDPFQGNVEEVLDSLASRGIDGGLSFDNPRFENGKLCATVHVWAKISVLGASASFDERIPVCINLGEPCLTVWEISFANLQICFRAPNQICGKLCVGKFGLEKCWEQCVAIPLPLDAARSKCGCQD